MNEHGQRLIAMFGLPTDTNPHALYRALHRIEARAHRRAEIQCSGPEHAVKSEAEMEQWETVILNAVRELLPNADIPIIINGDPRGYALKIPDAWMHEHNATLHRDMGGYGIICPDF